MCGIRETCSKASAMMERESNCSRREEGGIGVAGSAGVIPGADRGMGAGLRKFFEV